MATTYNKAQHKAQQKSSFARTISHNKVSAFSGFHWLALAVKDFINAPVISLVYGIVFAVIPSSIIAFVGLHGTHLVILPSTIAFALIGPVFAIGLYDVAWELEKGHKPTFKHSFNALFRNASGEWGFVLSLTILMICWTRLAALIHALYPKFSEPTLEELLAFLSLGSTVGLLLLVVAFSISAFAPQIMVERRVDFMTAISTSVSAVAGNLAAMLVWSATLIFCVLLGFLTAGLGFVFVMPILAYASWHAYIAVIKTKIPRKYE